MHYSFSVYFVNQPLHVSGIFVAHHQEVYYIYKIIFFVLCFLVDCLLAGLGWNANRQSTEKHNTYQLLYIYSKTPDEGLQICPKHVEVE